MTVQSWVVAVDGFDRNVSIHPDPQTGRIGIRVDGRMAAKPISPNETERDIAVGGAMYKLRRLDDGSFDLDLSDAPYVAPRATMSGRTPVPPAKSNLSLGAIIAIVVGVLFSLYVVNVGRKVISAFNIPWQTYSSPDGTFRAKFAGIPEVAEQSLNLRGDLWNIRTLKSQHRNHIYFVEFVDVHLVLVDSNSDPFLKHFVEGAMTATQGQVKSSNLQLVNGDHAIDFTAHLDKSDQHTEGDVRGRALLHKNRLYFIWGMTPPGGSAAPDIDTFLGGFELL